MSNLSLSNIQGNILKGFNKPNVRLIFFNFSDTYDSKRWLRGIADRIPNTLQLLDASKEYKEKSKRDRTYRPQETWLHISLSAYGLRLLNKDLNLLKDKAFAHGMKKRADILGDHGKSAPVNWIEPFKSIGMAGVLIIASDQVDDADAATINELSEASEMGIIAVGIQKGTAITNEKGNNVEHFGFRDGVSQPLIKGIDDAGSKGNDEFFEPSDFVLAGPDYGWANEGSFLVYRRLRQDVNGFWNFVRKTSKAINLSPELLASKFVGRWDSGAPLAKYPDNDPNSLKSADDNDFEYMIDSHGNPDDPRGFKTPRFSHIRKVYPRDDGLSTPKKNSEENDRHRILRRGIPYGKQMSKIDNTDRGLLFMCYQKNLSSQFEYIQAKFANNPRFPKPENGIQHGHDPIIGRPMKEHDTGIVNFMSEKKTQVIRGLKQWVVTTGGEYFFSPSLSALKNL